MSNSQPEQPAASQQGKKEQGPGYYESSKTWYNKQYESWMPWIEDNILGWFGENKTSYVAKGESPILLEFYVSKVLVENLRTRYSYIYICLSFPPRSMSSSSH